MNDISFPVLVRTLLAHHGALSSAELQSATNKSQVTISRVLRRLQPQVQTLSKGPGALYGLTRNIMGRASQQAIHLDGAIEPWGQVAFLEGERLHVQTPDLNLVTQGELPWFLEGMRPQGFLGRLRGQAIGYPDADPEHWTLEQTLFSMLAFEHDAPGALTLGDETGVSLPAVPLELEQRALHYDHLANNVALTSQRGSFTAQWEQARTMAKEFWLVLPNSEHVSEAFRHVARLQSQLL